MRHRPWGWNPEGRRRWFMLLIWFGHLVWVLLGHSSSDRLQAVLDGLTRPGQRVTHIWTQWRQARREKASNLRDAQNELESLRWQVTGLRTEMMKNATRLAEADEAVALLGLKKQLPLDLQTARILVNVRKAPFGGMVLDKGQADGLAPDQGVICSEGVVGRTWAVSPHQASLLPLDAYNASTSVMLGRSHATGVLQGTGAGRAEIRYIGSQEVVQVGEPVLTSGLDRVFPRGLLVGYVASIHHREAELGVRVALAAPLDRVDLVLILPARPEIELRPPSAPVAQPAQPARKRGAK